MTLFKQLPDSPSHFDQIVAGWEIEKREKESQQVQAIIDAGYDVQALLLLADQAVPQSIRSFAALHHLPEFTYEVWRQAFVVGWRAAMKFNDVKEQP